MPGRRPPISGRRAGRTKDRRSPRALALAIAAVLPLGVGAAGAQSVFSGSPDVTVALAAGTLVTADEDVAVDNQLGLVVLEGLGALATAVDVVALGLTTDGDRLIAFDTTTTLSGGVVASPGDVVRYDGSAYTIVFDASAEGVPSGARTDAASLAPGGLLLSFDTTVDLGGVVAADEDLVRWNGSAFSLVFDGSVAGLADGLDVDGGQDLGGGSLLMSFDTTGSIGGLVFDDEDVLRFDGSTWSLELDASSLDGAWSAADLDAVMVPEPGPIGMLIAGVAALAGLRRLA